MRTMTFIRACGRMGKQTVTAYSWTPMEACTRANGLTTNNMGTAQRAGVTIRSNILDSSSRARRAVMDALSSKAATMRAISSTDNFMVTASTTSLTQGKCTKANSKIIIWRERAP